MIPPDPQSIFEDVMNRFAYLATGQLVALMEGLSRLRVHVHNREYLPKGSIIFVVNHFTRMETLLVPYHIYRLSHTPVWSLADHSFFEGAMSTLLDTVGALSTRNPDRDLLMVKSLLTGEANWIIYPEGRMVKDKGGARNGFFSTPATPRPHSGAASLALRTEFYRQRLMRLSQSAPEEAQRLCDHFGIPDVAAVLGRKTYLVPVNLTYYPLRARENVLSLLADLFLDDVAPRLREEILTEGSMLFSGVDIDLRFAPPIELDPHLCDPLIQRDIRSTAPIRPDDPLPSRPLLRRASRLLMERYMTQIYSMTTVNHDHLCASLLRALPLSAIREDDFRRRVYLLASRCLEGRVNCHRSLEEDQVALLTDDRYHKYRDFLLLAVEKGVLEVRGGVIFKDRDKFSPPFDLHRARLDNPIGVIANEVVPLKFLQREVLKIAWLPRWLVRRRVAERLERQAVAEFEADYGKFSRPKDRKDREVGAPLLLRGRSRTLGVVLVHGFLAAPLEVVELARYLRGEGFWVYVVRLRGHGTAPEDLALRSRSDWMASVDRGYALMRGICRQVVLGGFSFGGGVALDCASRVGDVAGVFAVSPPHRLMDISSRFVPAVAAWNRVMEFLRLQGGKLEYAQIVPERPQINYNRLPIRAVHELEHFMKQLEPKLPSIAVPALVVQGDRDPVVDPRGSRRLFEMLGSEEKEYRLFSRTRHGILAGEGAQEVHETIAAFLKRVESRVSRNWGR